MAETVTTKSESLPLYQVLEEEYVSLHGVLPDEHYSRPPQERLKAIYEKIHALEEKRAALCISGGGIRSATFALGVLQGLARRGMIDKFDFLSTVSQTLQALLINCAMRQPPSLNTSRGSSPTRRNKP